MKKYLTLILLLSVSLFGASFDCAKATSKVEKMICADPELSALDENLSKTFNEALKTTDDKEQLKKEQFTWMKERNQCLNKECIANSYLSRIDLIKTNNNICNLILKLEDAKGVNISYNELSGLKFGDLVEYQNGYEKYFLEQYSTQKPLIELAENIKIKKFNGRYYILKDFVKKRFTNPEIFKYEKGNLVSLCKYKNIVHLTQESCQNSDICKLIETNKIIYLMPTKAFQIDLNNDGIVEALTYDEKMDAGKCDYQTYILSASEQSKDIYQYLSELGAGTISKCFKNINFFTYNNQIYVLIEGFDYGVTVYLVEKNKITVIGKFKADISIQGE